MPIPPRRSSDLLWRDGSLIRGLSPTRTRNLRSPCDRAPRDRRDSWQGPCTPPSWHPQTALPFAVMRLRLLSPQTLSNSLGAASLLVVTPPWPLPSWPFPPWLLQAPRPPPGKASRNAVRVEVGHVVGAPTQDGPAAVEGGEERSGVLPLAALQRARRHIREGNPPPLPGPSPVAPA